MSPTEPRKMLPPAEIVSIGRDVIAVLEDRRAREFEVRLSRIVNAAHVPFVHALSRHTVRLGGVALDLHEKGLTLESAPTIRMAFECALTACWVADSREALPAVFNEEIRQRVNLSNSLRESVSEIFRTGSESIAGTDLDRLESIADSQARRFKDLCLALGSPDAYAIYRALSANCHPSAHVTDAYVDERGTLPEGYTLRMEPDPAPNASWLFLAVASMI